MAGRIINIDEVKAAVNIEDVVSRYVDLKKTGSSFIGLCPFHNEKTPSFHVKPATNHFKCFGCGKGGDAIQFLVEHRKLSFYEAIDQLAGHYNIVLQYDQNNEPKPAQDELDELRSITKATAIKYAERLKNADPEVRSKFTQRLSEETLLLWQVGYAPDEWKFLTDPLIEKGKWKLAEKIGLVKNSKDQNYDCFRNRMMFPILDLKGHVIGFSGRDLSGNKDVPKYYNSSDSILYSKSNVLFGLKFAERSIRDRGFAILVEGNIDVIKMHESGMENTVGSCGTALTDGQCRLLKKYTERVIIIRDGDKPGKKAALKDIDLLLPHGFKIEIVVLKDGKDPDNIATELNGEQLFDFIEREKQDAVFWKASQLITKPEDPDALSKGVKNVATVLYLIRDEIKRDAYVKLIAKSIEFKEDHLRNEINKIVRKKEKPKEKDLPDELLDFRNFLPKDIAEKEGTSANEYGFFAMNNRYYKVRRTEDGQVKWDDFTNFTLKIKYHIYDKKDPKRIIELTNVFGKKVTVDAPTDTFTSTNNFMKFIEGLGNFIFKGGAVDLMRLKSKLFAEEKECILIDVLGYNRRGFWAWSNGIFYKQEFIPCDDDGIVDLPEMMYYIPAGNKMHSANEDEMTNQKNFRHIAHQASFKKWSEKMYQVFGNNGMIGMCFGLSCLFSDIIFPTMTGFPMLFLYGEGSSGKGKLMSFIQSLCGVPQTPLKISEKANTDKAKIREMAQFRNGICGLEEYTNAIDDKALNTLKGIWDRLGYKRAIMDSKFGNESVPINSGVIVTGNEYPSDDPLLQRLIVLEINKNKFTQEEKDRFNDLAAFMEKGITSITNEVMKVREQFAAEYRSTFQAEQKELSNQLALYNLTDRMVNNVTAMVATYQILKKHFDFPFDYNQLTIFIKQLCEKQSSKREMGAPVQQFWDTVLQLANAKQIRHEREYHIDGDSIVINYSLIFPLYVQMIVLQRGVPQKKGSLMDKLKLSKAFVEAVDSHRYGPNMKTSGYKFKYSEIGVDLYSVTSMLETEEKAKEEKIRSRYQGSPDSRTESNRESEMELALEGSKKIDDPF